MNRIMTVRAPSEMQEQLAKAAEKTGVGRNALVLTILWDWLNTHNEKPEA